MLLLGVAEREDKNKEKATTLVLRNRIGLVPARMRHIFELRGGIRANNLQLFDLSFLSSSRTLETIEGF